MLAVLQDLFTLIAPLLPRISTAPTVGNPHPGVPGNRWPIPSGSHILSRPRPLRQQVLPDTTGHFTTMSAGHPSTGRKRLDSWKEIAAFFGRDERTVNRWEKELGLPVHRLPGTKGRVYAFAEELSQWLKTPNFPHEEMQGGGPGVDPEAIAREGVPRAKAPSTRNVLRFALGAVVALVLVVGATRFVRHSALSAARTSSAMHAPNPEALDLYLKGRYEWSKRSPESLNKAVDYFTQAIVR